MLVYVVFKMVTQCYKQIQNNKLFIIIIYKDVNKTNTVMEFE